jgi:hypothetical protein
MYRASPGARVAALTPIKHITRVGRWQSPILPAVFNLNGPAHYVNWHFFHMSVANVVVIVLMIVVFILAIIIPFPKREIEE